jgi:TonB family protein
VSSAANTLPPEWGTPGSDENGEPRPNEVTLEIPVSVTGAKPSSTPGTRDLFSEESSTVQVYKDGAVISLAAPVAAGQLLFLTNQKTGQEVVCQVLRRQDSQAAKCHVELQFTEERPDYWGIEFPVEQPRPVAKIQHKLGKEAPVPAPSPLVASLGVEDPHGLDDEVEALRKQLLAADAKREKVDTARAKEELASVNDPTPEPGKAARAESTLLMPAAKDTSETARAVIGMALPISTDKPKHKIEEPEGFAEELLPKTNLDFSQIPKKAAPEKASAAAERIPAPSLSKGRMIGLSAVLALALAGGAWYGKWWQYLPVGTKTPSVAARPVPARNIPKSSPSTPATKRQDAVNTGSAETTAKATEVAATDRKNETVETKRAEKDATPAENTPATAPKGEPSSTREQAPQDNAAPQATQEPTITDAVENDAPVTPPKLVKAANPVYPPDAMRSYITGDVKAEVMVDASGHVTDVKVLSGPQALRAAAADALKQYQYAPAMQGSKPVVAKTTAIVKFWFNP